MKLSLSYLIRKTALRSLDHLSDKMTKNSDGSYNFSSDIKSLLLIDIDAIKDGKLQIKFKEVKGDFECPPSLTSLEGVPEKVGGSFNCADTNIPSLKGSPKEVGKDFYCNHNRNLTSLEGSPKIIRGDFRCSLTRINSLKGAPEKVDKTFDCSSIGALNSLEGAPKEVGGDFNCSQTPKGKFTVEDVKKVCNVKGNIIDSKGITHESI